MNLNKASSLLREIAFRTTHALSSTVSGGVIDAFGTGDGRINEILVINLDRQSKRWQRIQRELARFRTTDGSPLTSIVKRMSAIDARDGRAVAATADVDPVYRIGNQLHVQPDVRLSACFDVDEPVRMTRQEIAVARSHIEAWKSVVAGDHQFVLILEDDVWFRPGAAMTITRGWQAAIRRRAGDGPHLLYLSYNDAGGTADRAEACGDLFEPARGLWYLSGYVLSRHGAQSLLSAMPVVGPVDMWINYCFRQLRALALQTPAVLQRPDSGSDNAYSILPYLARAGIVDAGSGTMSPARTGSGPVLAWTTRGEDEGLAMALAMLGLRVRAFDGDEKPIEAAELVVMLQSFDALIDAPLGPSAIVAMTEASDAKFVFEGDAHPLIQPVSARFPRSRILVFGSADAGGANWTSLSRLLGVSAPTDDFPVGAHRRERMFRDDRPLSLRTGPLDQDRNPILLDDSPWILRPQSAWPATTKQAGAITTKGRRIIGEPLTSRPTQLRSMVETFPGNLAVFVHNAITYDDVGGRISITAAKDSIRPYKSGALLSKDTFAYGRFEADIKVAAGQGLVTGFFLHRAGPRQEIDIEFAGNDPQRMLANVFFNPGDDGSAMGFGYRGTPCHLELGFDSTLDFHRYAIDWHPGRISWSVDGVVIHERVGWDPTPIPHLPMRLHANLWAPRSQALAGRIAGTKLPSSAWFRNVSVYDAPD